MRYLIVDEKYRYAMVATDTLVAFWEKARDKSRRWTGRFSKVRYKLKGSDRTFSTRLDVFQWLVREITEEQHTSLREQYEAAKSAQIAFEQLNKAYVENVHEAFKSARPVRKSEVDFEVPA